MGTDKFSVRLRELLDELAEQLGPPDEGMVAEAVAELTALSAAPAVVLTGDPDDLGRLIGEDPGVIVQPLP